MHGVILLTFAVGLWWMGKSMKLTSRRRIVWWIGAGLTILGTIIGWMVFLVGIAILGAFELGRRNRRAGLGLVAGAVPLAVVYLRGVRYGDENSRPATNFEELLAVVGVIFVAIGVAIIGVNQLRIDRALFGRD